MNLSSLSLAREVVGLPGKRESMYVSAICFIFLQPTGISLINLNLQKTSILKVVCLSPDICGKL